MDIAQILWKHTHTVLGTQRRDLRTKIMLCYPPDTVYWTELRYEEQGRYVVCSYNKATNVYHEWTPKDFSARTTVHEYGGGDFFVYNGAIYFSNFSDQVLYVQRSPGDKPEPVTDTSKKWRYADGAISPKVCGSICL